MWSLRLKENGEFYLTYDRGRRFTNNLRGTWVDIGRQGKESTNHCIRVNSSAGLLWANDDEGGVRVLVLE